MSISDTEMVDSEPVVTSTASKGKQKADNGAPDRDNLPWYVPFDLLLLLRFTKVHRVEKYRPVTLNDVVSHHQITSTSECLISQRRYPLTINIVEKFIEKNRLPHLLFYGPPGTGKTSTILAVARRIYGSDYKKQTLEVRLRYISSNSLLNTRHCSWTRRMTVVSMLWGSRSSSSQKHVHCSSKSKFPYPSMSYNNWI